MVLGPSRFESLPLKECRLDIDDFGKDPGLQKAVRTYNDVLSDYLGRAQILSYLYNRHVN
jgi:hypothetical protein